MPVAADDVVRAFRSTQPGAGEQLLARLRDANPDEAEAALAEVVRRSRGDVRAWCAWLAARSLPEDRALKLALRVAQSRDPDVAHAALEVVERLDPTALRPLARRFRRMLDAAGKDWYDAMTDQLVAMRILGRIGDRESLGAIRSLRDDPSRPQNVRDLAAKVVAQLER